MSAKKPALQLVREGNPGHRSQDRLAGGVRLAPEPPGEPSWSEMFPSVAKDRTQQAYVKRVRGWASEEWGRVVRQLDAQGLLAIVDHAVLVDHCSAYALGRECLRDIALKGLTVQGERGWQKNGSTTILQQQREVMKHTRAKLGLSPVDRDSLNPGGVDDEDDVFD